MKLIFFLVAFFLISIRIYFSWSGKDREKRGISESHIVVKADHFYEEIRYSGKFILTDDESGFKSISPGGQLKFVLNDTSVKAESNLQGKIDYHIYDGHQSLDPTDSMAKNLISESVHEMIYWGFDAKARMERIYKKGGDTALLAEVDHLKTDNLKSMYLTRLLASDSLSSAFLSLIIRKTASLGSDYDKVQIMKKIPADKVVQPQIADAYFSVFSGMGSDIDRSGIILQLIDEPVLSDSNRLKIISVTGELGSDMEKKNLYLRMIEKRLIDSINYDSLLLQISRWGSDYDKFNIYIKLVHEQPLNELQWISLIGQVSRFGSDMDKSNVLQEIAIIMPKTSQLKTAYLTAARHIQDDLNYGRTIRAIE